MTYNHSEFYSTTIDNLTLAEALKIHYEINPQFTVWNDYSTPEAQNLIKSHDISHVIYGCDTSYGGEFTVQTWNNYGSDQNIPFSQFPKYILNKDLVQIVLPRKLIQYALTHIGEFIKINKLVKSKAQNMRKKWQYFDEERYMNTTIGEIRKEYGINLIK
jgi:ubiquinone biosynthesis protein Coq4